MTAGLKQHVELHRKLALRKALLKYAVPGAAYVPFCGDGDVTKAVYTQAPVQHIYAADLDPQRVLTFSLQGFRSFTAQTANCDQWPFSDLVLPAHRFAVADFDAYAYPYDAFRAFWTNAKLAPRLVLFFTDGQRRVIREGPNSPNAFHHPDGRKIKTKTMNWNETRSIFNFYMKQIAVPWLTSVCGNVWTINLTRHYLRDSMIYWGAVITRK